MDEVGVFVGNSVRRRELEFFYKKRLMVADVEIQGRLGYRLPARIGPISE